MAAHPVLRPLLSLIMAISVTHTTPADASFSADGIAAWNTVHAVSGLATVAESGDYNNLTGTPTIITLEQVYPVGSVYIETSGVNPATTFGFGTWNAKGAGQVLVSIQTGSADFGTANQTGGVTGIAATGTISTPTFTGDNYTPSGTNAASLSRDAVAGTNAITLFREASAGTNAASTVAASVSADWPTGVPICAGTGHQHILPVSNTGSTGFAVFATTLYGVSAAVSGHVQLRVSATATGPIVRSTATGNSQLMLSSTVTAAGIISWPATAPSVVNVTATAKAQVFTGVTGSVSGSVFTGATVSVSGQVFTGVAKAPTGTVSKPTFTGDMLSNLMPYITVYMWERTA